MTPARALVAGTGTVLLVAVDLVALVRLVMPPVELAPSLGVHAGCAIAAGVLLSDAAPPFVRGSPRMLGISIACMTFFVPVLGLAGIVAALVFGLSEPRPASDEAWVLHDAAAELDLQRRRTVRGVQRRTSAAEIGATLRRRGPEHAAERFRAVLETKRLPMKLAVPLLRLAQRDPSDEVRLYAFSRLEGMRDEIERRLDRLRGALDVADESARAHVNLRLAESYCELGTSGLAEGAVRAHALASAARHARSACELAPSRACAEVLRGRVLLELRDPGGAAAAFEAAMLKGYPRGKVLLHIADCAFQRRDFAAVRSALAELAASPHDSADARDVIALWTQAEPARPVQRQSPALTEQTA